MYPVGSWIRVADCMLSSVDFTGYILEKDINTNRYKIKLTKNKYGKSVDITTSVHEDGIYSADIENGYDTSFLIDIALDTKDEEWFVSLWEENIKGENENVER
jgi:hypothetical protein